MAKLVFVVEFPKRQDDGRDERPPIGTDRPSFRAGTSCAPTTGKPKRSRGRSRVAVNKRWPKPPRRPRLDPLVTDDEKPKMLRFSDVSPELRRLDKAALDHARAGEEQLESEWKDGKTPESDHTPKGRAMVILVLLGAIVVTAIYFVTKKEPEKPAPTLETEKVSSLFTDTERRELVTKKLDAFFAAKTNEERLALVINPEEVRDRLERFYEEKRDSRFGSAEVKGLRFVLLDSQPWAWATVNFPDRGGHVISLQEADDDYKIDWDCLVGYGELSWSQLRETRPNDPVQIRVFIQLNDYYNYHYSDPKAFAVYSLRAYETASTVYGYVERDSATHKALQEVIAPGTLRAVNIKMHFDPKTGRSDQAQIDELLHVLWTDPKLLSAEKDK